MMRYKMRIINGINSCAMLVTAIAAAATNPEEIAYLFGGVSVVCFVLRQSRLSAYAQDEGYRQKVPLHLLKPEFRAERIADGTSAELLAYIYNFQQWLNQYMEYKNQTGDTTTADHCQKLVLELNTLMNDFWSGDIHRADRAHIRDELTVIETALEQLGYSAR